MSGEWTNCPECGVLFGVPYHFLQNRREDNRRFWCPNGHNMSYTERLLDKVQREAQRLKQQIAQKDDEIREAKEATTKVERKLKRVEKRVHAGVCTCCNRTFANVARHMATKHPEMSKPRLAEAV